LVANALHPGDLLAGRDKSEGVALHASKGVAFYT